jgi:hypothetical protein
LSEEISVFENVRVAAQSRARVGAARLALAATRRRGRGRGPPADVRLAAKRDELAENLWHGEQRYLEMCLALATEPPLLLLDEPTASMTPGETKEATALIRQIATARGLTVLLIEHDMSVVMADGTQGEGAWGHRAGLLGGDGVTPATDAAPASRPRHEPHRSRYHCGPRGAARSRGERSRRVTAGAMTEQRGAGCGAGAPPAEACLQRERRRWISTD